MELVFFFLMKFSGRIWKLFVPPSMLTIRGRLSKWQFLYLGRRGEKGECWGHWEWNVAKIWILIGHQYPLSLPIKKEHRPPRADGQHFRAHKIKWGERGEVQLDFNLLSLFSLWNGVVSLNASPAGLLLLWLNVLHHWKLPGWGFWVQMDLSLRSLCDTDMSVGGQSTWLAPVLVWIQSSLPGGALESWDGLGWKIPPRPRSTALPQHCQGHQQTFPPSVTSTWLLNICRDGDSNTAPGRQFPCLTTFPVKEFFQYPA